MGAPQESRQAQGRRRESALAPLAVKAVGSNGQPISARRLRPQHPGGPPAHRRRNGSDRRRHRHRKRASPCERHRHVLRQAARRRLVRRCPARKTRRAQTRPRTRRRTSTNHYDHRNRKTSNNRKPSTTSANCSPRTGAKPRTPQDDDGKFGIAFKVTFDRGAQPTKLKVTCRIAKTISDEIESEIEDPRQQKLL